MAGVAGNRGVTAEVFAVDSARHQNHPACSQLCSLLVAVPRICVAISTPNSERSAHEIHHAIEFTSAQILNRLNVLVDLSGSLFLILIVIEFRGEPSGRRSLLVSATGRGDEAERRHQQYRDEEFGASSTQHMSFGLHFFGSGQRQSSAVMIVSNRGC